MADAARHLDRSDGEPAPKGDAPETAIGGGAPILEPSEVDIDLGSIRVIAERDSELEAEAFPGVAGVAPIFGGFRPVLGRPDSVEGEQALLEVMEAFEQGRPHPSAEVLTGAARILAVATFSTDSRGQALTEKLIRAILTRNLDTFGAEDRQAFAGATGLREFPEDPRLSGLQAKWVLRDSTPEDEVEVERELGRRGVRLVEIVPGRIWLRGEALDDRIELGEEFDLTRFLEGRRLSNSYLPPYEGEGRP
ncbi:MAG: hypothetical protein RL417_400 [Pseudomonadota bacterium]|jgi:hypothetical protein